MIIIAIIIIIIIIIIISLWRYEDLYCGLFLEKPTFFSLWKFVHLFIYVSVMRMTKLYSSSSTIL
jgi:hypothetical protein